MASTEEEKFDPIAWWKKKREKYRKTWDDLEDQERGLAIAKEEYEYRSGELEKATTRTNFLTAIATAAIAAYAALLLQSGGNVASIITAKVGMTVTAVGFATLVYSYLPRWRSRKERKAGRATFISPAVWTKLIRTPFDEYAKYLMRTERKSVPLDRYKDLLRSVCCTLILGFALLVVAFVLR